MSNLSLVSTREIELFLPVMREIDFGDAFLLSMLHWCGIGKRSSPVEYWQVFLLRAESHIIGVSGLYRQQECPPMFAGLVGLQFVLNSPPAFRHRSNSPALRCGPERRFNRLLVYTGRADAVARLFYRNLGFEVLGPASDYSPGKTMDDSDIVLYGMRDFGW